MKHKKELTSIALDYVYVQKLTIILVRKKASFFSRLIMPDSKVFTLVYRLDMNSLVLSLETQHHGLL